MDTSITCKALAEPPEREMMMFESIANRYKSETKRARHNVVVLDIHTQSRLFVLLAIRMPDNNFAH